MLLSQSYVQIYSIKKVTLHDPPFPLNLTLWNSKCEALLVDVLAVLALASMGKSCLDDENKRLRVRQRAKENSLSTIGAEAKRLSSFVKNRSFFAIHCM